MKMAVYCDGSFDSVLGMAGIGLVLQVAGTSSNYMLPLQGPFTDNNIVETHAVERAISLAIYYLSINRIDPSYVSLTVISDSNYVDLWLNKAVIDGDKPNCEVIASIIKESKKFKIFVLDIIKSHTNRQSPKYLTHSSTDIMAKRALKQVLDNVQLHEHQFFMTGENRFHAKCKSRVYGDDQGNRFCTNAIRAESKYGIPPMEDLVAYKGFNE